MRTLSLSFTGLVLGAFLIAGCGGSSDEADSAPSQDQAETSEAIVIEANDQLQFSVTEFTVAAGEEVVVNLVNVGTLPKETFGHNIVFLNSDVDLAEFATAAMSATDTEYIPAGSEEQVLIASALLGPNEEDTITFTAPSEPGRYEYLCSFPGHFGTMRGVMIVE